MQKTDDNVKDAGSKARLEYTKFLLEKNYKEMAQTSSAPAGIVVIFDSADGQRHDRRHHGRAFSNGESGRLVGLGPVAQMFFRSAGNV